MNWISRQTDRDRSFVGAFAKSKLSLKKQTFCKNKENSNILREKKIQTFCKKNRTFCKNQKEKTNILQKKISDLHWCNGIDYVFIVHLIQSQYFFSAKTKVPSNSRKWGIFQNNAKRLYWNRAKPYIIRKSKHDCLSVSSPCSLFINTPMK